MDSLLFPLELSFLLFAAVYAQGTSNVALWKNASQSSNYSQSKYLASRGVDGNVGNNAMKSGSCFHTTKEYQPWWRVDLHQDYYITSVVMHNRLDCCTGRARNIELTIGKSLDSMSQAGYLDGGLTTHTFTVDPPLVGCFVQLQLKGITEYFHLCEVEVMAYPSDSDEGNDVNSVDSNKTAVKDSDDGNDVNSVGSKQTAVKEFPINTTVLSGIIGGVCVLVIFGATGILLKRKYSNGCFPKANEKSEEISRNPDAPVDTVPSARDSELYTEIEGTPDRQAKCTGESSFTVQTREPSQYEGLSARESKTYTEIDSPMYENIR